MQKKVKCYYFFQTHQYIEKKLISNLGNYGDGVKYTNSYLSWIIVKSAQKVFGLYSVPFSFVFLFWSLWHKNKIFQQLKNSDIFAIVGVDSATVYRAFLISIISKSKLTIYLVDDIESHPAFVKSKLNKLILDYIFKKCKLVYCITDELAKIIADRHSIKTKKLPLMYIARSNSNSKPNSNVSHGADIIYIGSINHLYSKGLDVLISLIELENQERIANITLRIVSGLQDIKKLANYKNQEWIKVGAIDNDAQLHESIRNAKLAFMPYSFEQNNIEMVKTSFPSKLLDYLAHSRNILVYAPKYSSVYRVFDEFKLGKTCTSNEDLTRRIREIFGLKNDKCYTDADDSSAVYLRYLNEFHSDINKYII